MRTPAAIPRSRRADRDSGAFGPALSVPLPSLPLSLPFGPGAPAVRRRLRRGRAARQQGRVRRHQHLAVLSLLADAQLPLGRGDGGPQSGHDGCRRIRRPQIDPAGHAGRELAERGDVRPDRQRRDLTAVVPHHHPRRDGPWPAGRRRPEELTGLQALEQDLVGDAVRGEVPVPRRVPQRAERAEQAGDAVPCLVAPVEVEVQGRHVDPGVVGQRGRETVGGALVPGLDELGDRRGDRHRAHAIRHRPPPSTGAGPRGVRRARPSDAGTLTPRRAPP